MRIELVRGIGKCIECGKTTSYIIAFNDSHRFEYFCDTCVQEMFHKSYEFLYKNNEYFKLKEKENETKKLIKRGRRIL